MIRYYIIGIIIMSLVSCIFIYAIAKRTDDRGVKQELVEKQTALLIDSAPKNTYILVPKINNGMAVTSFEMEDNKIFIGIDDLNSVEGYSFFSKYTVSYNEEENYYRVKIG